MSFTVKAAVDQQFSAVAANYTTSHVHAQGEDLARMVDLAASQKTWRVLDAGCGAGHAALTFAPHVAHITGVDLSEAMLAQCRQNAAARSLTNVDFRRGDVEALPFEDASFDLVISRYSAHHWPQPQQALREIRRVLQPGGQFILSDIVSFDDFAVDTHVQAIELLRDPSHVRDHTVAGWRQMLGKMGFLVDEDNAPAYEWSLFLQFDLWTSRMKTPAAHVEMVRALLDNAPQEVREALRVEEDSSFTFRGAILVAKKEG